MWAPARPDRAVAVVTEQGLPQAHSWTANTGHLVGATTHRHGVRSVAIDPAGNWIWWFDQHEDGHGQWRRQPFNSTPGHQVQTPIPLPAAASRGLLLGSDGSAVIGRAGSFGTQVHAVPVGPTSYGSDGPTLIYASPSWAQAQALSFDNRLIAVEHSEQGDPSHPAIRVFHRGGQPVAELDDGPARGLWALGFAPADGDHRLLVRHMRSSTARLLIWDVDTAIQRQVEVGVDGNVIDAAWYPDANQLLVAVDNDGGTSLQRVDLHSGQVAAVGRTGELVLAATPRPDGEIWVRYHAADLRSGTTDQVLLKAPGAPFTDPTS